MELKLNLKKNGTGEVILEGKDISNITTAIVLHAGVGTRAEAEIHIGGEIEFEGPVEISIVDIKGKKIPLAPYLRFNQ